MTPKIFLDTNALIYLIENHPDFSPKISPIFNQIFQNQLQSITSIITVTEVLVNPMKQENKSLIEKYLNLFTNLTSLKVVEPNMQTAIDAAHIKAVTPTLFFAFTSAPLASRTCTTSPCPSAVARNKAVPPFVAFAFTSAPAANKTFTVAEFPFAAAAIRAVAPITSSLV